MAIIIFRISLYISVAKLYPWAEVWLKCSGEPLALLHSHLFPSTILLVLIFEKMLYQFCLFFHLLTAIKCI